MYAVQGGFFGFPLAIEVYDSDVEWLRELTKYLTWPLLTL